MQTQKKTLREKRKTLLKLFLTTLYISAFTFGGGFVIVTFMKRKFVDELHWIDDQEMLDLAARLRSHPRRHRRQRRDSRRLARGGLSGNDLRRGGDDSAADDYPQRDLAVLRPVCRQTPQVALVLNGMQAGVAAVILDVVIGLGHDVVKQRSALHLLAHGVMVAGIRVAVAFFDVNVILIILAAALVGVLTLVWRKIRPAKQ